MSEDYKVGYGKPPKHTQFPPGVSGNQGRKRKISESHKEVIARVRDEVVEVNGRTISKFELAVQSTVNQTIKSGKPRDLKFLLDLLDKYGALPEADRAAEAEVGANMAIERIMRYAQRWNDVDPADVEAIARDGKEEAAIVIACPTCGPRLKQRWKDAGRQARQKRYGSTGLIEASLDGLGLDHLFDSTCYRNGTIYWTFSSFCCRRTRTSSIVAHEFDC